MSLRDPNAVDLSQTKVRLADDVVFWPVRERGQFAYRLEIPSLHRFFRIGYEEYVFVSLLDGNTTVPQACGLAAAILGKRAPTAGQAASIQRWLLKNELAYVDGSEPPVRDPRRPNPAVPKASLAGRLNPFWIKVPLTRDGRWIDALSTPLRWCFSKLAVVIGLVVILTGMLILYFHRGSLIASTSEAFSAHNWIWLLVTWITLKCIHELGHAVCCRRHGGEVHEFGLVFILFTPLAYVDVTSCWRMPSRWKRIAVSSAGMFIELIVAAIAILFWINVESPLTRQLLYNIVFTAGLSTILFNANALMRFDGYFILADLVQIPNLYVEGAAEVRRIAKQLLLGMPSGRSQYDGWRLWFLRIYGVSAILWKIVICLSLSIAASTMFAGAGIAIAAMGVAVWFGKPLVDLLRFCRHTFRIEPARMVRGAVIGSAMLLCSVAAVFWLPISTAIQVAGITRYPPETLVRSGADGFVVNVHTSDGTHVRRGDLLIELRNPELEQRLASLMVSLQQNELRQRKAIDQKDASSALVLREQQASLDQQIDQLQKQVDGLRVIAPRDGCVIARELSQSIGTYKREGDTLLTIAVPSEKEMLAVVDQQDIAVVRNEVGATVPIRLAHFEKIAGKVERIDPRASDRLPAPPLSAVEGGPLAVRADDTDDDDDGDDEDRVRLIQPHFAVRVQLDRQTAARVAAGMRTRVAIGYRNDPLAARLKTMIRRMWYQAHGQ